MSKRETPAFCIKLAAVCRSVWKVIFIFFSVGIASHRARARLNIARTTSSVRGDRSGKAKTGSDPCKLVTLRERRKSLRAFSRSRVMGIARVLPDFTVCCSTMI